MREIHLTLAEGYLTLRGIRLSFVGGEYGFALGEKIPLFVSQFARKKLGHRVRFLHHTVDIAA